MSIHKKVINSFNIRENSKVLDAGCGTGNLLYLLSRKKRHYNLYGIDISEKMIKIARAKLKSVSDLELRLECVEEVEFGKGYFDYIFSTEAFHHYGDHDLAMQNFYKSLKKQGRLVVVDFDFGRFFNRIFHLLEPGNSKMHTTDDLKELFKKYGFRNIETKSLGWFVYMTVGEK